MLIALLVGAVLLFALAADLNAKQYNLIAYGEGLVREPRYRTTDSELRWSDESSALPVENDARWVVLRACPRREEVMMGVIDADYNLTVQIWKGTGWSNILKLENNTGSGDARFFDIAYESKSGNAVVVYGTNEGRSPRYRIWNGSRWSRARSVPLPGDRSRPQYWVVLEPDPLSDEMVLVCQDDYRRLYAGVWNGGIWVSCLGEFDKSKTDNYLGFGVCRQSLSGDVVVVWRPEEQPHLMHMTWNGTSWGPILTTEDLPLGTDAGMVELTGDPQSDRVLAAVGDVHGDLAVAEWSGSQWSPFERLASNCRTVGENRSWDLIFEGAGGRALLVYSDGSAPELRYRIHDGGWSEEMLGPDLRGPINVLELESDRLTRGGILLSLGEEKSIECLMWDGDHFSAPNRMETNAAFNNYEPMGSVFVTDRGPSVALISPNGGERLEAGRIHMVRWQAAQDLAGSHVDIYYTASGVAGGILWKPIVLGEVNRFEHPWMVPFEPSEQCLVKVVVFDESMNSSSDASDSLFTIYTNTGAAEETGVPPVPNQFELLQNEPNPFQGTTKLRFLAPLAASVRLTIFDSGGRQLKSYSFVSNRGENSVVWDGRDRDGRSVPPGIYFGCFTATALGKDFRSTTQMILIE